VRRPSSDIAQHLTIESLASTATEQSSCLEAVRDPGDTAAMDSRSLGGHDDELHLDSRDAGSVAHYIARERQKHELRRERDVVVLALARDLGERALAERMDVTQAAIDRLVAGARDRLGARAFSKETMIVARRLRADPNRWADADAHFEALGSGPRIRLRRGALPP
jgi:hypothetical protein